jgi:hypothetical protein
MNAEILTTNPSQAETNLITAWYGTEGNSTLPNATLDNTALPNEWSASTSGNTLSPTLYSGVVQTSCRSCHSTRDPNDPGQGGQDISWDSYSGFSLDAPFIDSLVCQPPNNSMPQAERTYARFWLSTNPNAPNTLANSGLPTWPPGNVCQ